MSQATAKAADKTAAEVIQPDPLQVLKEMKLPDEFNARMAGGTIDSPGYSQKEPVAPEGGAPAASSSSSAASSSSTAPSSSSSSAPAASSSSSSMPASSSSSSPAGKDAKPGLRLAKNFKGTKAGESFTPEKIIELTKAAAREGAAAAVSAIEAKRPAADAPPEPQLLPEEQEALNVMAEMERLDPEKYKGLVANTKAGLAAYEIKVEEWTAAHPGQQWNEDGHEASALKAELLPSYTQSDYDNAQREAVLAPLREKNKELQERVDRIEADHQQRELAPVVLNAAVESARDAAKEMGLPTEIVGHNGAFDQTKVQELEANDPDGAKIILGIVDYAEKFAAAATILFAGHTVPNNNIANGVAQAAMDLERNIQSLPANEQEWDGRKFAPRAEFYKLPAKDRGGYWTLDAADVIQFAMTDEAGGIIANGKRHLDARRKETERAAEVRLGWKKPAGNPQSGSSSSSSTPGRGNRESLEPAITRTGSRAKPRTTDTGGQSVSAPPIAPSKEGTFLHRTRHGTIAADV